MIAQDFISHSLDVYSELFDTYMDTGVILQPSSSAFPDPLRDYLIEAITEPSNHFHCLEDEDWRESFKNSLFEFLETMLEAFAPLEQLREEEERLRCDFMNAPLEEKIKEWNQIAEFLQDTYAANEVNTSGFFTQMQDSTTPEELNVIFTALSDTWMNASDMRFYREEQRLISLHKAKFEKMIAEADFSDYRTTLQRRDIVLDYPELREIVELIGRNKPQSKEEKDTIITRHIPILLSQSPFKSEVDGVKIGNHIPDALPTELVYLSNLTTEDVFYHRFATSQLQLMASKPPTISEEKTEIQKKETPRLIKGPIIVSVDTSGSMSGRPLDMAIALLMQLLTLARRQRRACYLITYSVNAQAIDLASPANWRQVKDFLANGFSGGTDGNEMLLESINTLQTKTYSMADVLIISDFCWSSPNYDVRDKMSLEQSKGTKFYGLEINSCQRVSQHKWLDRFWSIRE